MRLRRRGRAAAAVARLLVGGGQTGAHVRGWASVLYSAPVGTAVGDHTVMAEFDGDAHYLRSAATAILTITP
jgi:hypothetical protein